MRFSVAEAADHLGLSKATVRRMCADGRLKAEHVGRSWVIEIELPMVAHPIEEYVWCTECSEPHGFYEGRLSLTGADLESMPCLKRTRVRTLPEGWESTYEAFAAYSVVRGRGPVHDGYDLYEMSPAVDPAVHRPMCFLEEA